MPKQLVWKEEGRAPIACVRSSYFCFDGFVAFLLMLGTYFFDAALTSKGMMRAQKGT
jgi:hypothetical protein